MVTGNSLILPRSLRAVSEASEREKGSPILMGGEFLIQRLEGSRFVRGGRYGISIDFGLEVAERESTCGKTFKSKFIDLTMKRRLTITSS